LYVDIHREKAHGKFKVEETDVEARPPPSSQLHAPGCLAFYPRFDASLWLNEQFYSLLPVLLSVLGDWEWVGNFFGVMEIENIAGLNLRASREGIEKVGGDLLLRRECPATTPGNSLVRTSGSASSESLLQKTWLARAGSPRPITW